MNSFFIHSPWTQTAQDDIPEPKSESLMDFTFLGKENFMGKHAKARGQFGVEITFGFRQFGDDLPDFVMGTQPCSQSAILTDAASLSPPLPQSSPIQSQSEAFLKGDDACSVLLF